MTAEEQVFAGDSVTARRASAVLSATTVITVGDLVYFYVRRGADWLYDKALYSFTVSYDPDADLTVPGSVYDLDLVNNLLTLEAS